MSQDVSHPNGAPITCNPMNYQLSDFWFRELPLYLPAASRRSCRLVCSLWADHIRPDSVIIKFPIKDEYDPLFTTGRIFHLAPRLQIVNLGVIDWGLFSETMNIWRSINGASIVKELFLKDCTVDSISAPKIAELARSCSVFQEYGCKYMINNSRSNRDMILNALADSGNARYLVLEMTNQASCPALASLAPKFTKLTTLSICLSPGTQKHLGSLLASFKKMPCLSSLDLAQFGLVRTLTEHLSDYLSTTTVLKTLQLCVSNGRPPTAVEMAASVARNKSLTEAHFRCNSFDSNATLEWEKSLSINASLKTLWLSCGSGDANFESIFRGLKSNKSITRFILNSTVSDPRQCSIKELCEALYENGTLTSLHLQHIQFYDEYRLWDCLASPSATLRDLTVWIRSDHGVQPEVIRSPENLLKMLQTNTSLTSLALGQRIIPPSTACQIGHVLLQNAQNSITKLQLSSRVVPHRNSVDYLPLAAFLESPHCKLRTLDVLCWQEPQLVDAIFKSLHKNTSLTHLNMPDLPIGARSYQILADALKTSNSTLLSISGRFISQESTMLLRDALDSRLYQTGLVVHDRNDQVPLNNRG